jgi:enoyl-CoA hydratase
MDSTGIDTGERLHPGVRLRRAGRIGHIVLDRPKALNALTLEMIWSMAAALDEWEHDDGVHAVVVSGAGDRGLCAGGDIVALYRSAAADDGRAYDFWHAEYRLNSRIAHYPKPYVALMDGIVLGGGVGISAHGSVRIVTERTRTGMPEVGIGFVPDVGGTWLLARAPGELGTHLALTGSSVGGADAIALGLADHYVESADLPALVEALEREPVDDAVARFAREAPEPTLQRDWIDACYAGASAREIVAALAASPVEEARTAASLIRSKSPTAVTVTLAALRRASALGTLEEALDQEFRVSLRCAAGTEFVEGVRAQVVDKDRAPKWSPATLEEVTGVEAYFAPLGDDELGLGKRS